VKMKILFVEDHLTFGPSMAELLRGVAGVGEVSLCRSMALAIEALTSDFYDLLILDLTIPANEGDFEIAPEHGQAVFYEAIKVCPGIPIFILTGSEMDDFIKGLVRHGEQVDLWGSRVKKNTLDYFEKENADRLFGEVEHVSREVSAVNAVTLNTRGRQLGLSVGAERCIRVAARRMGASAVEVIPLSGGLSRARVIRATMKNGADQIILATAAKLGSLAEIEGEVAAFDKDAKRLPIGFFPPLAETVDKGACGAAGAFYQLAEGYSRSVFDLLAADEAAAVAVVNVVRDRLGIWINANSVRRGTIADVRRRILWDETFAAIVGENALALDDIETRPVAFRESCIHGDLHGANILVDANAQPVLIDFGDVAAGSSSLDPVMLDLSAAFHPDAVRVGLSARIAPTLGHWPDPDACYANHPLPDFAKACRDWAYDVAGSDLAVLAAGYAYVLRQLRYDAVDRNTTLWILGAICERIRAA
jgi:CheY-like chemotaxis protein